ncbi:DegV family protein [Ureaplasma miroungigenitalium]|uniref:DegV family protein n=1 Tax=Ureaplasma miroungigenitalium TaxID=1042321 RepID=A0ABT3BM16_9BACT|nr:DegV family protein [Ureaplasma miroungigenitalium]MCV3728283.1 DegV family protein [Ureaplasma miroungigenitalium]MCV3734088.1 DegV family protein [Ureaplasma miroungigenitalium]
MQKFIILTDSSSSIDPLHLNNLPIRVLPLSIMRSDEKLFEDEPTSLSSQDVFDYIDEGYSFSTSCSVLGKVYQVVEELSKEYEKIIFIGISKGFSSQYNNLKMVAQDFKDQLIVADTQTFGYALEHLALSLVKMLNEREYTDHEIKTYINEFSLYSTSMFACKDINGLVKSGRISKIKGVFLKIAHVIPIIKQEYKNHYGGLARNYDHAHIKMIDLIDHVYNNQLNANNIDKVAILHANLDEAHLNQITEYLIHHYGIQKNDIVYRPGPNVFTVYTREKSFAIQMVTKIKKTHIKEYYPLEQA